MTQMNPLKNTNRIGDLDGIPFNRHHLDLVRDVIKPEVQFRLVADILGNKMPMNAFGIALWLGDEWIDGPPLRTITISDYSVVFQSKIVKVDVKLLVHGQALYLKEGLQIIKLNKYENNIKAVNGIVTVDKILETRYSLTFGRILG